MAFYAAASAGAGDAGTATAVTVSGAAEHSQLAAAAGHFRGTSNVHVVRHPGTALLCSGRQCSTMIVP